MRYISFVFTSMREGQRRQKTRITIVNITKYKQNAALWYNEYAC